MDVFEAEGKLEAGGFNGSFLFTVFPNFPRDQWWDFSRVELF